MIRNINLLKNKNNLKYKNNNSYIIKQIKWHNLFKLKYYFK